MAAFEAEAFGGAAYVAVTLVDFLEDVVALVGFAGFEEGGELFAAGGLGGVARVSLHELGKMFALDASGLGVEDEDALDEIAQLADVAGPMILLERGEGVFVHLDAGPPVLGTKLGEKLFDEQRDILLAIAQRRDEEGDDVEAIEEVFAEVAAGDLFFKVFVGGGDDAYVDVHGVAGADGKEALFVEGTEDLGLGF